MAGMNWSMVGGVASMNWSVVASSYWGVVGGVAGVVSVVRRSDESLELVKGELTVVASKLSHVDLALGVVDPLSSISEESDGVIGVHVSLVSTVLSVERLEGDNGSLSGGGLTVVRRPDVGFVVAGPHWGVVGGVLYRSVVASSGGVVYRGVVAGPDWGVVGGVVSRGVGLDVLLELFERDGARVVSVVLSEGGLEVSVRKVDVLGAEESSELGSVHLVVTVGVSSSE